MLSTPPPYPPMPPCHSWPYGRQSRFLTISVSAFMPTITLFMLGCLFWCCGAVFFMAAGCCCCANLTVYSAPFCYHGHTVIIIIIISIRSRRFLVNVFAKGLGFRLRFLVAVSGPTCLAGGSPLKFDAMGREPSTLNPRSSERSRPCWSCESVNPYDASHFGRPIIIRHASHTPAFGRTSVPEAAQHPSFHRSVEDGDDVVVLSPTIPNDIHLCLGLLRGTSASLDLLRIRF